MVKMRKKITLIAALILLIILFGCSKDMDNKIELSGDLIENLKIEKTTTGLNSKTSTGKSNEYILKIREFNDMNSNMSDQIITERLFVINSAYRDYDSPYPGALSNQLKCSDNMKPIENDGIISLYATDRLTFGACSEELIRYGAMIRFLHCNDKLYQVELFSDLDSDKEELNEKIKKIGCK